MDAIGGDKQGEEHERYRELESSNLVEQINSRILPLRFERVFDFLVEMTTLVMKDQYDGLQRAEKWLQEGLFLTPHAQREYDLQKVGSSSFRIPTAALQAHMYRETSFT